MKVNSIDSICIWSENWKELAKFYKEVLNLPVDKVLKLPKDTGVQFKVKDIYLFIGYHDKIKGKNKDPFRTMIGFSVDSVSQTYEELNSKRVNFILKPSLSPNKTFYVVTAQDPDGNIIQFFSDKP